MDLKHLDRWYLDKQVSALLSERKGRYLVFGSDDKKLGELVDARHTDAGDHLIGYLLVGPSSDVAESSTNELVVPGGAIQDVDVEAGKIVLRESAAAVRRNAEKGQDDLSWRRVTERADVAGVPFSSSSRS